MPLPRDPFYDDQPINELDNDILAAFDAIKPEPRKTNFAKQSAGDKNKDLKQVMREQDAKDRKILAAKEESKQKYTVKNNFTPRPAQKAKVAARKLKAKPFQSAEDEVNQYMKELGLI